jgi:hypothetical protein
LDNVKSIRDCPADCQNRAALLIHMPSDSARTTRLTADRLVLAGVLLFTLVARGGVLWALRDNLADDPDAYRQIAENLLRHGVFAMGSGDNPPPTAYRPPLYPIVLSNLPAAGGQSVSLAKVAALHLFLGVATVWLTWLTARRVGQASEASADRRSDASTPTLTPSPRGSAAGAALTHPTLAALLVACDPLLLHQQSLVMTETLATFLAILALWCLAKFSDCRSWFWAGLSGGAIGLAVLCRPTFLPWLGLVAVAMLVVRGGRDCKLQLANCKLPPRWSSIIARRLANAAFLVAIAAGVLAPWVIRNQRVLGTPIVTTTHGGYTLWLGNNVSFYDWLRHDQTGLPWDVERGRSAEHRAKEALPRVNVLFRLMNDKSLTVSKERFEDQFHIELARDSIYRDPYGFLRACLYRIGQLWSPLPHKLTADESLGRRWLRYATCAWYCGVFALAAVGVWRLRWQLARPPWVWGLLLCLAFTAVHTLYWSNLRMRAPLMPFVALVAAMAVVRRESERHAP